MKLSPCFTLEEFIFSETCTRSGIDNMPTESIVANLRITAAGMEKVRVALGNRPIHITSGYRCEALEKILCQKDFVRWCGVRGKKASDPAAWNAYFAGKAHPKGYSADFVCRSFGTPEQIVAAIRKTDIRFDQLIMEGNWVHISFAPDMRMQAMSATFDNGTPSFQALA